MTTLTRMAKFNLVGAMGVGVQLGALALLNRWLVGHYLWASALALEATLLHNYAWHRRFTWRDRGAAGLGALARFHLSSGLVSLVGNLGLMRVLAGEAHLPVLAANAIAIVCCSAVNFCLANGWAFAGSSVRLSRSLGATALAMLLLPAICWCQSDDTLPDAPIPAEARHTVNNSYSYNAGAFCGVGASTFADGPQPTLGCGAGITVVPLPVFLEVGVMVPPASRRYFTGYVSLDSSIPLRRGQPVYLPMALVGYSRLFDTGHAFDYGLALAMPRLGKQRENSSKSLRIELRDYWTFAGPSQHNVMLRIGWMAEVRD